MAVFETETRSDAYSLGTEDANSESCSEDRTCNQAAVEQARLGAYGTCTYNCDAMMASANWVSR